MSDDQGTLLNLAFQKALVSVAQETPAASLIGLEHEYRLLLNGGQVDFRDIIHTLPVPGRRLDPGDSNAYRLRSGLALTCDDLEAEIASPPIAVRPGFGRDVDAWAGEGYSQLRSLLPSDVELEGFSTHLSASLPDDLGIDAMRLFGTTFAPLLMLMMNSAGSFGVYVRPRPGRLELCGDYAGGTDLTASAVFFTGAVKACVRALEIERRINTGLPPPLGVSLSPASGRYGVYVSRRGALGFDICRDGRQAVLPRAGGGTTSLQSHLERAWEAARAAIEPDCNHADLDIVDAIVRGDLPLRSESLADIAEVPRPARSRQLQSPYGAVLELPRQAALRAEAVAATWDFTIVRIASAQRDAFACIPRDSLEGFTGRFTSAPVQGALRSYVDEGPFERTLSSREDALRPGVWDAVRPAQLLPEERGPDGSFDSAAAKKTGTQRAGKVARIGKFVGFDAGPFPRALPVPAPHRAAPTAPTPPPPAEPPKQPSRPLPWRPLVAAGAVIAGVVLGAAVATGLTPPFGGGSAHEATATATSTSTTVPTHTWTVTPKPTETAGPTLTPTGAAAPAVITATPRPPTATPRQEPPTSTPVVDATQTPTPALDCGQQGASTCTPTATPTAATATSTRTPESTRTPSPTPCFFQGAICTATPTRTPSGPAIP